MDLNFTLLGILGLFIVILGGSFVIYRNIDQKYPKVKIQVRRRGTVRLMIFRLRGSSIVQNSIQKLLMNDFNYYGDISFLTYDYEPKGTRLYYAYMRDDYLIGIDMDNKTDSELLKTRPIIDIPRKGILSKGGRLKFTDGILIPLTLKLTNEEMHEKTILSGREVALRAVKAERNLNEFLKTSNPLMAILISSIPLFIMGAIFCAFIYFGTLANGDVATKIAEQNAKIIELLSLRGP